MIVSPKKCNKTFSFQDPAGIFELIEVVGNGTYGQVYKVSHILLMLFENKYNGIFRIVNNRVINDRIINNIKIKNCIYLQD